MGKKLELASRVVVQECENLICGHKLQPSRCGGAGAHFSNHKIPVACHDNAIRGHGSAFERMIGTQLPGVQEMRIVCFVQRDIRFSTDQCMFRIEKISQRVR